MSSDVSTLLLGAIANLAAALLIVRGIYYPRTPERNYVFSFLAFNTVIYFVMAVLTSVEIGIGVGFGLFAIFSVLRYRTEETPFREMTYLFVVIALPIVNSILVRQDDLGPMIVANVFIAALLFVLERGWGFRFTTSLRVTYDRLDLMGPAHEAAMLADLRQRTGMPVTRFVVHRFDFVRDTAELTVYAEPASVHATRRREAAPGTPALG